MQKQATPIQAANWQFEEALYRAYTDAYERHRLIAETDQELRALVSLAKADRIGSLEAMVNAERALAPDAVESRAWKRARRQKRMRSQPRRTAEQRCTRKRASIDVTNSGDCAGGHAILHDQVSVVSPLAGSHALEREGGRLKISPQVQIYATLHPIRATAFRRDIA